MRLTRERRLSLLARVEQPSGGVACHEEAGCFMASHLSAPLAALGRGRVETRCTGPSEPLAGNAGDIERD